MNVREITNLAARLMGDEGGSAWNETDMLLSLKLALHRLFDDRPELLLSNAGGLVNQDTEIAAIQDAEDELPESVPARYLLPLAHFICYLCYMEDSDSTANAKLMETHMALYERAVS